MSFVLQPWQFLLVILAGWINQLQQQIIEFQRTETELLKKSLISYAFMRALRNPSRRTQRYPVPIRDVRHPSPSLSSLWGLHVAYSDRLG